MKKIIALLLSLTMIFTLTACSKEEVVSIAENTTSGITSVISETAEKNNSIAESIDATSAEEGTDLSSYEEVEIPSAGTDIPVVEDTSTDEESSSTSEDEQMDGLLQGIFSEYEPDPEEVAKQKEVDDEVKALIGEDRFEYIQNTVIDAECSDYFSRWDACYLPKDEYCSDLKKYLESENKMADYDDCVIYATLEYSSMLDDLDASWYK